MNTESLPQSGLPDSGSMHGAARQHEAELAEAIRDDEARQGRPLTPGERRAFAEGFRAESARFATWRVR